MSSGCGSKTMRIQINSGTTLTTSDTSNVKLNGNITIGTFNPLTYYSYTADAVGNVKTTVTTWAGVGKISTTEYEQSVTLPSFQFHHILKLCNIFQFIGNIIVAQRYPLFLKQTEA
jgi:hypothetical protein